MANIKHSKFRNTGILFDLIVRQVTSDTISGKNSPALDILKEYFTNTELAKEYKLYNVLATSNTSNESKANILIETTVGLYKRLNKSSLKHQRYNLIKEIKNHYNLEDFFKAKINNYKTYAAAYTIFESTSSTNFVNPDVVIKNKVVLLENITKKETDEVTKDKLMEEYLGSDNGTRFLIYKILVNKFNQKYSNLSSVQKDILREYINNISNTNNLKEYINEKFIDFKKELKTLIKEVTDNTVIIKLTEVIKLIKPIEKNESVKDEDVLNLLHYSQLITELKELK